MQDRTIAERQRQSVQLVAHRRKQRGEHQERQTDDDARRECDRRDKGRASGPGEDDREGRGENRKSDRDQPEVSVGSAGSEDKAWLRAIHGHRARVAHRLCAGT